MRHHGASVIGRCVWPKRSERGLCPRDLGGRFGRGAEPPSEYKYHGRVKALADAARAAGLQF